jgi:diguanylate cyclase (GGDEF)-like protein
MLTKQPHILLFSKQEEPRQIWFDLLDGERFRLTRSLKSLTLVDPIDVIVCDQPISAQLFDLWSAELEQGEIGVISVGVDMPADVVVPEDCTGRELALACELLAEIVHLRRQQREERHARREMSQVALTDPLTSLPNRRAWDEELSKRCKASSFDTLLCLAVFDVDKFKNVNDELGHSVGDAVLKRVGQTITDSVRDDDFVARLGGDEFGLLMWFKDGESAAKIVERVRATASRPPSKSSGPNVTVSAGVSVGSSDREDMFQAADSALLQAKAAGRNRTVIGKTAPPQSEWCNE